MFYTLNTDKVKKVIVSLRFYFAAICILSSLSSKAQNNDDSDTNELITIMNEFNMFLINNQVDSAIDIANSFDEVGDMYVQNGEEELGEFCYSFSCFMKAVIYTYQIKGDSVITITNNCLVKYIDIYRTNGMFKLMHMEYELHGMIYRAYADLLDRPYEAFIYINTIEPVLQRMPESQYKFASFSDFYINKARFYRWEGNTSLAEEYTQKAISCFTDSFTYAKMKYKKATVDTINYLRAVSLYLDLKSPNDTSISVLYKTAIEIASSNSLFLQMGIDLKLKECDSYSSYHDYAEQLSCYLETLELLKTSTKNYKSSIMYFSVLNGLLECYSSIFEWNKVLEINQEMKGLSHLKYSSRNLEAHWQENDTLNANISYNDLIERLTENLNLLDSLPNNEKSNFWSNYSTYRDLAKTFLIQSRQFERLLEFEYYFKGSSLRSILKNPVSTTASFANIRSNLMNTLTNEEAIIGISSFNQRVLDSMFRYIGLGVKLNKEFSDNGYPFVYNVTPFSQAYYANVKTNDVLLNLQNADMQNVDYNSVIKKILEFRVKEPIHLSFLQNETQDTLNLVLKRDSIYHYFHKNNAQHLAFTISQNDTFQVHTNATSSNINSKNLTRYYKDFILRQKNSNIVYNSFSALIIKAGDGFAKLKVVPDGSYSILNIETLPLYPNSSKDISYIGDSKKIKLYWDFQDLLKTKSNIVKKDIVLFGYPNYTLTKNEQVSISKTIRSDSTLLANYRGGEGITGSYVFTPLPATKHEVEDIGTFMKQQGWDVQTYTGNRALEEQVKAVRSPRVLHIATHGFFAGDIKPEKQTSFMGMESKTVMDNLLLRSGLAFAGAERTRTDTTGIRVSGIEDGILTADEVQYLNLDSTELVVLSACETGLGEIVNGEGVYGLQRAFRSAGAKSVLMSLWKVDDMATETLMKNFYKHWLDDGMNKHDALWQAKLDLRNDKEHPEWAKPYYWGAFVLIGE